MNCLKCGKDTAGEQVFCPDCLAVMDRYPVKPGTAIQLPQRELAEPTKKQPSRKRGSKPEDVILQQKRLIRWLMALLVVLSLLLSFASGALIYLSTRSTQSVPTGQNYTTGTGAP